MEKKIVISLYCYGILKDKFLKDLGIFLITSIITKTYNKLDTNNVTNCRQWQNVKWLVQAMIGSVKKDYHGSGGQNLSRKIGSELCLKVGIGFGTGKRRKLHKLGKCEWWVWRLTGNVLFRWHGVDYLAWTEGCRDRVGKNWGGSWVFIKHQGTERHLSRKWHVLERFIVLSWCRG